MAGEYGRYGKTSQPNLFNFQALVVWHAVRCCYGEELGPFCSPTGEQVLQFAMHLIDLLSILLRCNSFTGSQKAVLHEAGGRLPFLVQVWLWERLCSFFSVQPVSWAWPVLTHNPLFITHHNLIEKWFTVVEQNKRRWHFKMTIFLICGQLMKHPLIKLFHLSNLLQMPNDCRMVGTEIFSNFSCSCKRISFDDFS